MVIWRKCPFWKLDGWNEMKKSLSINMYIQLVGLPGLCVVCARNRKMPSQSLILIWGGFFYIRIKTRMTQKTIACNVQTRLWLVSFINYTVQQIRFYLLSDLINNNLFNDNNRNNTYLPFLRKRYFPFSNLNTRGISHK